MKQFNTLASLVMLFFSLQVTAQTIYVRQSATGSNDGSSWNNAYTKLGDALATANPGAQVWVAAGTYKPDVSITANNSFSMVSGVALYGGFAGTETSLGQRNFVTNITTLSGDIAGDDNPADPTLNRTDNSFHVLVVQNGDSTQRAVVDGFVIRNGNTKVATADPDYDKRGGGILAIAKLTVKNCTFRDNAGLAGAGLAALDALGSGLIVTHCTFENNFSNSQCAGLYIRYASSGLVNNCIFRKNHTNRGSLYPQNTTGFVVDSCLFEGNKTDASQFCAGLFTWQSTFVVKNCIFRHNTGANATSMYNDGRDGTNSFTASNCLFEDNSSTGYTAGMYNWQANATIKNCTFRRDTSSNAAGMYNDQRNNISAFLLDSCLFENNVTLDYGGSGIFNNKGKGEVKNSTFRGNTAPSNAPGIYNGDCALKVNGCLFDNNSSGFGASIANFGLGTVTVIDNNVFQFNKATTSGGAIINGFKASATITNCTFSNNTAKYGGAIYNQNDSTKLSISGTLFDGNAADNDGGGVNISAGIVTNMFKTVFKGNSANFGGGIAVAEDSLHLGILNLDRVQFIENLAFTQAAAINVADVRVNMVNCEFNTNQNFGSNPGGAISNNGFGGKKSEIKAINCTFSGNLASAGAGISQFEADSGKAILTLQNCIFISSGDNYGIEQGNPTVISNGGNLSSDATLGTWLINTNDLNNLDPQFIDPGNYNLYLQPTSPCINKGIAAGAPTVDLAGNNRIGIPDMGCFEFGTVGTSLPSQVQLLTLAPNPTADAVQARISNDWTGKVLIQVRDASGKVVRNLVDEKTAREWTVRLDFSALPNGIYFTRVQTGGMLYGGSVVKQ
jgi:predicted outer membrane repeat protein